MNGHSNGTAVGTAHGELTSHQRQYLSKMLAQLAMSQEWANMAEVGALSTYGLPFSGENAVPDKKLKKRTWPEPPQSPILRYMYRHFLMEFPGLKEAPHKFWTKTVQPVWDDFASRNLPGSKERSEVTKRRTIAIALTNYIGTVYFKGLKAATPSPELERSPARPSAELMEKINDIFPAPQTHATGGFYVSIVKIDLVKVKIDGEDKRVEQYLICTRAENEKSRETFVYRDYATFKKFDADLIQENVPKPTLPPPGPGGFPSKENLQLYLRALLMYIEHDPSSQLSLTLKSFLLGFALDFPEEKRKDLRERIQKEEQKLSDAHAIWVNTGEKVKEMREGWRWFVDGLLAGHGLDESFEVLKNHSSMYDIPTKYRRAEEWARVYVAYSLHYLFVAAPNANEAFYLLQVLHHFFPYAIAKQLLKIANPAHMIKALVALLFGGPVGTKSVFSRVFAYLINKDVKSYKKQIEDLRKKIAENTLSDKLLAFVGASTAEQEKFREKSRTDGVDLVVSILVRAGLSEAQEEDVLECYHAFLDGVRSGDTTLLNDNADAKSTSGMQAMKFKWLKRLLRLYSLKKGHKEAIAIWDSTFESFFRDSLNLYYPIISAISKASNLSARLGDLQRFLDDLIKTVLSSNRHPSQFIALCERHEQSLWYLFHECHANGKGLLHGQDLTRQLQEWFRKGLDFMRDGILDEHKKPVQVNLEEILATNPSLAPKVLAEIDQTTKYVLWNKTRYELSLRANLIGDKLKVDVDGLLRSLMESEGADIEERNQASSTFGMVDWGYFYDPQVVDSSTQLVMEGEQQPGEIDDGDSTVSGPSSTRGSKINTSAPNHHTTGASPHVKPPVLLETRKFLGAYLKQVTPALNHAADLEQWGGKVKTKK